MRRPMYVHCLHVLTYLHPLAFSFEYIPVLRAKLNVYVSPCNCLWYHFPMPVAIYRFRLTVEEYSYNRNRR